MQTNRQIQTICLFMAILMASCSSDLKAKVTKECVLPSDQSSTLKARWPISPTPIAFHSGDFTDAEKTEIKNAALAWNSFYIKSKGFPLFDVTSFSEVDTPMPSRICSDALYRGDTYIKPLVIYKQTTWTHDSGIIALTQFCSQPLSSGGLGVLYMAAIEFNYQHFFKSGSRLPHLNSVAMHEFGHSVGVDHSCEPSAKTGVPLCQSAPAAYTEALMFPVILFPDGVNGEVRNTLKFNDQSRANCLYQSDSEEE